MCVILIHSPIKASDDNVWDFLAKIKEPLTVLSYHVTVVGMKLLSDWYMTATLRKKKNKQEFNVHSSGNHHASLGCSKKKKKKRTNC